MKRRSKWSTILIFVTITKLAITETPSLVKYGQFCMQPPGLEVEGKPQTGPAPFELEIFYLRGKSNEDTLQLVLRPLNNFIYHYMVMQAINQNGIPQGQFHHYPCSNAKTQKTHKPTGLNRIMNYCTMGKYSQDPKNKKYKNTNLMYTMYRPEEGHLQDAMVFWSWPPHLKNETNKQVQFRYAAIQEGPADDTYWIMHSPVIEFKSDHLDGTEDVDAGSAETLEIKCYTDKLSANSGGSFHLTQNNAEIPVDRNFLQQVSANAPSNDESDNIKLRRFSPQSESESKHEVRSNSAPIDLFSKNTFEEGGWRNETLPDFLSLPYDGYFPTPQRQDGPPDEKEMYQACWRGKGCLEDIPGCAEAHSCHTLVTYSLNHDQTRDYFRFELMARTLKGFGYVALGLSSDTKMGDDSVIECVVDWTGKAGIYMSWNSEHHNNRLTEISCTDQVGDPLIGCNVTLFNGKLLCNFYRRNAIGVGGKSFNVMKTPYHIHRASGYKIIDFKSVPMNRGKRDVFQGEQFGEFDNSTIVIEGHIGYHDLAYSTNKKGFLYNLDDKDYEFEDIRYIKLHGVFMVLAWVVFIPNAVFISRYFKESYLDVHIFQLQLWKVVHIGMTSVAGAFILLSMVMIWWYSGQIKEQEGYYPSAYSHMSTGYVTVALCPIQVLIVVQKRPETSSNKFYARFTRSLHFVVGTFTYVLALILIARAHVMMTSIVDCYGVLLIGIYVTWSVVWHAVISVHMFIQDRNLKLNTWRTILPIPFMVLTERNLKGEFFRVVVFAIHASGAAVVSVLLVIPYLHSRSGCFCDHHICSHS
ncbi:unnamed protein product [Allacma fusca]|uniref:Ferric-chelate reductase 1 n=1 Tax=Allacma fusca TaxID=39272 RepID=A0A8J2L644_9HEXA|nr:unnamed protein product [Allacma fusca]